jgi:hypothetical protein
MKKMLLALLVASPFSSWSQLVTVNSFNDVQYWTGAGTNRAALVLDFGVSETPASIAWGYRWNGNATVASMLFAVTGGITGSGMPSPLPGADVRLSINGTYFASFDGYFINSISYDQIGLPAPWSQSLRLIQDNWAIDGTYPSLYSIGGNGTWTGTPLTAASVGISGLSLTDGGWFGFAQTDGQDPYVFAQPASAVPEPSALALLALGAAALLLRHRRLP